MSDVVFSTSKIRDFVAHSRLMKSHRQSLSSGVLELEINEKESEKDILHLVISKVIRKENSFNLFNIDTKITSIFIKPPASSYLCE